MGNQEGWIAWLRKEAATWVKEGIIDESQHDQIIERYPAAPPPLPSGAAQKKKVTAKSLLPSVLVGLAALLIGVGLILFYAANWKKMPPSVKLIQVFLMILLSYGGAFSLIFAKRPWPIAGRALLALGMVCFGAGIALVVQIYHISAQPARCVLLWAAFVAAMSALMRDRMGLYLALALVLVWDIWERAVYGSANYPMILAIAILYLLAVHVKCVATRFICVLLAIFWFYAVNAHHLADVNVRENLALFALMQIPFGVFLIGAAIALGEKLEAALATMIRLIGWLAIYAPLIILSWPISFENLLIPGTKETQPFLIEFVILTVFAAGLVARVTAKGQSTWQFLATGLVAGAALLFLPLNDRGMLMTAMLSALLLFHALTLFATERIKLTEASIMAFGLAASSILIRSVGHFALSIEKEQLFVAAGLSGLLFVVVMFFMNLLIGERKKNGKSLTNALSVICVCGAVLILYIVSFVPGIQLGIFDVKPVWMIPAGFLALLSVGLAVYSIGTLEANRKLLIGAGITTILAIALLILPGESFPPSLRQLILNATLFMIFGFVIAYAVEINSPVLVNVGVAAIVVLVMTRYFDVFWDMLQGSLFFIVTGVSLFAIAGFMEWQRRRLLNRIRESGKKKSANP